MKKKSVRVFWAILTVLVAAVGIKVVASPDTKVDALSDAKLTVSETTWDFGDIPMSGGVTTRIISLKNESFSPITITRMETSCMCTTTQIVHSDGSKSGIKGMVGHTGTATLSETIQAGEVATLLVNFDPNAHGPNATGPITRNVLLGTNSQAQSEIKLTFSGNVIK